MRYLAALALSSLGALPILAQSALTVNTPSNLIVCIPSLIQWSGGTGPYYLTANAGGSSSDVLATFVNGENVTSYTWTVDLAAGTAVTMGIRDATGATNFAQQVTVQAGSSTTCLNSSGSGSTSDSSSSTLSSLARESLGTESGALASTSNSSRTSARSTSTRATSAASSATQATSSVAANTFVSNEAAGALFGKSTRISVAMVALVVLVVPAALV
ncbi:hypothetical protein K437DRAFT_252943 [Tilletiaria anomala UBC 951]|uniref:Uncharacterized protein n=1 Tax=Tilletiaria anomala (strain ATCC 24038 / CBS 436.72 / UBC 951) TaxID=1037660 RepID=A0A066WIB1_TILAU|nr:uncharacterized protein K437DRAFT_252943 [Tilletiaria anomala UBC 951]KDN53576.1 hypothetical protein K437DRAFT_252943 [Tilletiaria anomala UBC 951]